jgi:predicted ester cyclase
MGATEAETSEEKGGAGRRRGPTTVAREYFAALGARDVKAASALWKPGATDHVVGLADLRVPEQMEAWFQGVFDAFPDFSFEVLTVAATKENVAVRWRATGTFDGTGRFEGMKPTGARIEIEGCDMLTVRDGLIVDNYGYMNGTDLARQLGAMPPRGSAAERGMTAAFNAKTAATDAYRRFRERNSG